MSALAPLAMSQTKDDLLKHLNLPPETYTLMAKETDSVYKWLVNDKNHLKFNCKRKPPYDWSDISEKAKDEAMKWIASGGDQYTSYYWALASPSDDCVNWIARWFLYHKFRYRDGRNRNPAREEGKQNRHGGSSKSHHSKHQSSGGESDVQNAGSAYYAGSMNSAGESSQSYYSQTGSQATGYAYSMGQTSDQMTGGEQSSSEYWDPVRNI